jgi:dihydroorotate dehydrogenase
VQIYTGMIYEGLGLVAEIKRDLLKCLDRDGFADIGAAVGTATEDWARKDIE